MNSLFGLANPMEVLNISLFTHFASIPTEDGEICVNNWDSDEVYNGFYAKYSKAENFFLEERDNVCNFINIYIEECEVM